MLLKGSPNYPCPVRVSACASIQATESPLLGMRQALYSGGVLDFKEMNGNLNLVQHDFRERGVHR